MTEELAEVEYKLHCQAIGEACWYLGQDRFSSGYRCLHAGLERVCESAAEEPWAADLARSYRDALFYYTSLHPGGPPPRRPGTDRG